MAMTHEQIDEQMVDFLYGELPADARAAFEAHVAGCDRCRREVESYGQVRAVARTVLDEAPPARAHDAILRAAREAAAAKQVAKEAQKEAKKATKKTEPARASLWGWLSGKWAFPTLATVGALTVFVLGSRLFLDPKIVRQIGRPAPVSEPAESPPVAVKLAPVTGTSPAVETPAPATAPAASEAPPPTEAPAHTAHLRRKVAAAANRAQSEGARIKDEPLDNWLGSGAGAREKSPAKRDDLLDGIGGPPRDKAPAAGGAGYAQPPAPAAEKPLANTDFASGGGGKSQKKAIHDVEDIEDDRVQAKEEAAPAGARAGKGRAYAPPPPPAATPAPGPASRYAEPPPSKAAAAEPESFAADDSADLAKAAPRPAAKAPSRASRGSGAAPAPAPAQSAPAAAQSAPAPAPATASRARSRDEEAESGSVADEQAVRETLAQRADRLFTQGRWAEAAVAYRDLLRQQPNSPDAERWRRRLAAARAAVATGRPPSPSSR